MTSLLQEDKQTPTPPTEAPTEELLADNQEPQQQPSSIKLNMNHNIRDNMEEETLPPSDILFDDMQELKFELLEKTITLEAADYSDCPAEYLHPLKDLLNNFSHRFSKSKLDLEITNLYTADLPTKKGKIVQQKVRR
jgi:bifunctional DNase/RNase